MFSVDDMFGSAKEPSQGLTFIGPGKHTLTLAEFRATNAANEAPKYRADFVVVESDFHNPGDLVSTIFQPYGTLFKGMGENEAGRMMVLVQAISGDTGMSREAVSAEFKKLTDKAQGGRGFRVLATGYNKAPKPNADGSPKLDKNGQPKGPFCVVSFYPNEVANTKEQVMADRAKIEALPQMQARARQTQTQTPQQAPEQAPAAAAPPETQGNGGAAPAGW